MMLRSPLRSVILLAFFVMAGCKPVPEVVGGNQFTPTPELWGATSTAFPTGTAAASIVPTSTKPPSLPTDTSTPAAFFCSPLEGYALEQIPGLVSNPFYPPAPGSDAPHQGIDLADLLPGSQVAVAGRRVQAVVGGSVAAVIQDRFPYGNALLVETPIEILPGGVLSGLGLSESAPTSMPNLSLTCPDVVQKNWGEGQSLYLLYAHLQGAPVFQPGDTITCGQEIGNIGSSGNALNPHLHLEARFGPPGARFDSMAHYDNSATPAEMDHYCTWRVRGIFRLVDPLFLLGLSER